MEYLVMGGHSRVGRGVRGVSFWGFVLCCGLMVVLVEFSVGGVRCWVAVGGVDYGD